MASFSNFANFTNNSSLTTSSILDHDVTEEVASNQEALILTRIIVQKFCVPLVVLVGVIGNSLSIVVLTRKCMKSSTNAYLTALALFDLLYLLFTFSLSLKYYEGMMRAPAYVYWFPWCRVLADMASNVSVVLTVTFTMERYVGVCHPMKGHILCTPQRAKIITAIVSTVTILCTTPEFWEMRVERVTSGNHTYPAPRYTSFAAQASYQVGYYWFLVLTFTLIPLVLLCIFNGMLISSVIRAAKLRRQMILLSPASAATKDRSGHSQPKEQQKITKMLITVVLVFILCQLPGALLLMHTTYISLKGVTVSKESRNEKRIAANVTNLLIQINAAINFILYSAISTKFRRVFWRSICRRRSCWSRSRGRRQSTGLTRAADSVTRTDAIHLSSFHEAGFKLGGKIKSCSAYSFAGGAKALPSEPTVENKASQKAWRRNGRRFYGQLQESDSNRNSQWKRFIPENSGHDHQNGHVTDEDKSKHQDKHAIYRVLKVSEGYGQSLQGGHDLDRSGRTDIVRTK